MYTRRCLSKCLSPTLPKTQQHRLWFVTGCAWLKSIQHAGGSARQKGGTPSSVSSQQQCGFGPPPSSSVAIPDPPRCECFCASESLRWRVRNVADVSPAAASGDTLLGRMRLRSLRGTGAWPG